MDQIRITGQQMQALLLRLHQKQLVEGVLVSKSNGDPGGCMACVQRQNCPIDRGCESQNHLGPD